VAFCYQIGMKYTDQQIKEFCDQIFFAKYFINFGDREQILTQIAIAKLNIV
jgi:hypothetical protein